MDFYTDYMRGCHPEIMEALRATNMEATPGYGDDPYTAKAIELVAKACGLDAEKSLVRFLVGGTQTNATVLDSLLRRYEGVLAAETAHINVHEAGAIEAGGHKVIVLPSENGKLQASAIAKYVDDFYSDETYPHMVAPGAVYISHPTELGTLYSLRELSEISRVCRERGVKLYLDGARLAYGLEAKGADVKLPDIARLADVFYIGGTKCGALFGEAVVAADRRLLPHFMTLVKQHGALLAKGRLAGIQFMKLFSDGLYQRIGRHGIDAAMALKDIFVEAGYEPCTDSSTNQQFFLLPNGVIDRLRENGVGFELWGPMRENSTPVRFVADWATPKADLAALKALLSPEGD